MPRLLDLFVGRWGWSRAFAARGWECIGVDLVEPPETPRGCRFICADILELSARIALVHKVDFICASSPCNEFSVHAMRHFHPDPPYPALGIKLFEHTRRICEESGIPYVMENVRQAENFVGKARAHAGSFYLWGNAVPPLLHRGLVKGFGDMSTAHYHANLDKISPHIRARNTATIPVELASCVAQYAERVIEQRAMAR